MKRRVLKAKRNAARVNIPVVEKEPKKVIKLTKKKSEE